MASVNNTNFETGTLHISLPVKTKKVFVCMCKAKKTTVSKQLSNMVESWLAFGFASLDADEKTLYAEFMKYACKKKAPK